MYDAAVDDHIAFAEIGPVPFAEPVHKLKTDFAIGVPAGAAACWRFRRCQRLDEVRPADDAHELAAAQDRHALDAVPFENVAISPSGVSSDAEPTSVDITSSTRRPCDLANSSASVEAGVTASSHQGRCLSVPISSRWTRSASLMTPTTFSSSSTTGSALTSCSREAHRFSDRVVRLHGHDIAYHDIQCLHEALLPCRIRSECT